MKLRLPPIIFIFVTVALLSACKPSLSENKEPPVAPPPSPPPPAQKIVADYKARMGDRYYIRSVFESVFMSESQTESGEASIKALIKQRIFDHSSYFGGPCRYLDPSDCRTGSISSDLESSMLPPSSVPREGLRIGLCLDLTEGTATRTKALLKANIVNYSQEITTQNLIDIYKLFYPGRTPSTETLNSLKEVYDQSRATNADVFSSLGVLLYTVCASPGWQVL